METSSNYLISIVIFLLLLLPVLVWVVRVRQQMRRMAQSLSEQLKHKEDRLRQVMDATYQLMILLDQKGQIQSVNISAMELIKQRESEISGLAFWKGPWWTANKQMSKTLKHHVQQAAKGKPQQFFAKHVDTRGALLEMDVSMSPIKEEGEVTLIVVEHDMQFVKLIADRVTVFHQGAILLEESVDEALNDDRVKRIYLGKQAS